MANGKITVALAGNPNAGKTSLFNALTGARQHVGNYPGITVEKKWGQTRAGGQIIDVVDLPGTYSLSAYSLEEVVARNFVIDEKPDVVVDVVDASNLERNLYLAVQFMELGVPVVIALNMMDVAKARGLELDVDRLSSLLGVPVVPTVAREGKGIEQLMAAAAKKAAEKKEWTPLEISYGPDVDEALSGMAGCIRAHGAGREREDARWLAIKILENDAEVKKTIGNAPGLTERISPLVASVTKHINKTLDDDPEGVIADYRYGYIGSIYRQVVTEPRVARLELSDKIDKVLLNRLFGPLVLLAVLYVVYQFVFWASDAPVEWFEAAFGWLGGVVEANLPQGVLRSMIVSGVIDGVGGVMGFVPLIMFMFLAIAFMEDSGYLARAAFLLDRVLRTFGLHGNSVVPFIIGGGISGGCAVPGVMATRTLADPKARMATILTVPLMNCGAKLPVYAVLTAAFFAAQKAQMLFVLTMISWAIALMAARIIRWTVLKGETSPFVMELPPYRMPTMKGLAIHTWERTWQYIKKAGTVILGISIIMWALMTYPGLSAEQEALWQSKIDAAQTAGEKADLHKRMAEAGLQASAAGYMGRGLEHITAPLGFDWRVNVALVGGFAAKEVIVSTMGTAYSLGEVEEEDPASLSQRLAAEPGWNKLMAFAMMIFVMVYAPCLVTVAVIRKETKSWKWALFSMVYTTVLAYILALAVYQGGLALGLGV